jgi:predicted glycoside hydrolase/deacetylase ChbG (UPF0249 family)
LDSVSVRQRGSLLDVSHVVLNADDFGYSHEHNMGVLRAHRAGTLQSCSLMIAELGADEAIQIAKDNPGLKVGLHIVVSDGYPVSPVSEIDLLATAVGKFYPTEAVLWRIFFQRRGREQLQREIHAQFAKFFATGLRCDHVNTHRHSHQVPIVAYYLAKEAVQWGVETSRVPLDTLRAPQAGDILRRTKALVIRSIMRSQGITQIRNVVDRYWTTEQLVQCLTQAAQSSKPVELTFHPAMLDEHYMFTGDLPALLHPDVRKLFGLESTDHEDIAAKPCADLRADIVVSDGTTDPNLDRKLDVNF